MATYSTLTEDGWVRFDDREEWEQFSMEMMRQRDMSRKTESDAMEW